MIPDSITITQPDDWHIHLRDEEMLGRVVPFTAERFGRALVMPNLVPPVTTVSMALAYRERICAAIPANNDFNPMMSLYLTDETSTADVLEAAKCPHILGFKLYPAGATTNSSAGVTRVSRIMPVLEAMADAGVALQVHGEVTDNHVDIFDREAVFIEQVLLPLHKELPELRIVLEHITTSHGVEFVQSTNHNVAGTITPQHLMYSRNELFRGGIRPHLYCLPILKREPHRLALVEAATSGDPAFFLGTDSAPHTRGTKESACGCAGIFSANAAIEYYAYLFEVHEKLEQLEAFSSFNGADFYKLERNSNKIRLERSDHTVESVIPASGGNPDDDLVPLMAGEDLPWTFAGIVG